ncbi:MAG: hypothetical protein HYS08_05660 [Chlamydiae bacterium]|nr:hypothetical protein [Chlamydiota bacterium]MBI3267204.1 hypothetical protein [Chlamydiota bacterium]
MIKTQTKAILGIYLNSLRNTILQLWPLTLRSDLIFLFLGGYSIGGFWILLKSFNFLHTFPLVGNFLLNRLWHFFFFILGMMLIFSNSVVLYSTQYQDAQTSFLFHLPLPPRTIFYKQLLEGALWSSWGFLFLSLPLMIAFGISSHHSWAYYLFSPFFLCAFIFLTSLLGASLVSFLISLHQRYRKVFLIGMISIGVLIMFQLFKFPSEIEEPARFQVLKLLEKISKNFSFSLSPYLPSTWVAQGLLSMGGFHPREGLYFLGMILALDTILATAFFYLAEKFYPVLWERNQEGGEDQPKKYLLRVLQKFKISSLNQKDIFIFSRDRTQWVQWMITLTLMIFYLANLKNINTYLDEEYWKNLVFSMNLCTCGLLLSTLSLRFVFPQFSLEARKSWILGLAPVSLNFILKTKFKFFYFIMTILGQVFNFISGFILKLPLSKILLSSALLFLIPLGLIAIALGIGIFYPQPKTDNPSKIMSGLGGILTLIFSLGYLLLMLLPVSIPFYVRSLGKLTPLLPFYIRIGGCVLFDILLSFILMIVALKIRRGYPWQTLNF